MREHDRLPTPAERETARALINKMHKDPSGTIFDHGMLGHADKSHINVSDEQLLDNILFEGVKNGDTVFADKDAAKKCMTDVLKSKAYHLAKFLTIAKPGDTITYYTPLLDDQGDTKPVGHGFIGTRDKSGMGLDISKPIRPIETNMAAVIITKDRHAEDEWRITTAFPVSRIEPKMSEDEKADCQIETVMDYDFEAVLHATESYKRATPMQRAILDYNNVGKAHHGIAQLKYRPYSGGREESVTILDSKGLPATTITGDLNSAVSVTETTYGRRTELVRDATERLCTALQDQIEQVREIRQERNKNRKPPQGGPPDAKPHDDDQPSGPK